MTEIISDDIIALLIFLLPGFITAWIYYGLTAFPKPNQFERIIQALIFTVIIQGIIIVIKSLLLFIGNNYFSLGNWSDEIRLIYSILIAIIFGLIISKISNNDKLYRYLRKHKFTSLTSYPSEWYGIFTKNKTYVVLHLNDRRRLYGWPIEWPSQPDKGHFSIIRAQWLTKKDPIKLNWVKTIVIPASEVKYVEFMKFKEDENDNYFEEN